MQRADPAPGRCARGDARGRGGAPRGRGERPALGLPRRRQPRAERLAGRRRSAMRAAGRAAGAGAGALAVVLPADADWRRARRRCRRGRAVGRLRPIVLERPMRRSTQRSGATLRGAGSGRRATCRAEQLARLGALDSRHRSASRHAASLPLLRRRGRAAALRRPRARRAAGRREPDRQPADWRCSTSWPSRAATAFENARLYRSLQREIVERQRRAGRAAGSQPPQGRVPRDAVARAAQPAGADPHGARGDPPRRAAPTRSCAWAPDIMDRQLRAADAPDRGAARRRAHQPGQDRAASARRSTSTR